MNFLKQIIKFFNIYLESCWPFKQNKYKFAFIVHPRYIKDVYREFSIFKKLPQNLVIKLVNILPPLIVSQITGLRSQDNNLEIKGCMISINLFPEDMPNNRELAVKKIIKAIKIAQRKGVRIVGLGGLTSSVTRGGLDLVDKVYNVHITTGHAYTAYNIISILKIFLDKLQMPLNKISVAIVGAAGSIGSSCAQILTRDGIKRLLLIDIERKLERINTLLLPKLKELNKNLEVLVSNDLYLLKQEYFIITATNAPEAVIRNDHLSSGTIILDDAQPSDVHPEVLDREDVLVIEAGLVHTPGIKTHFNFGFKDKYDNYSCLAEILVLASIDYKEHFVIHRADLEAIDKIKEWSKNLGFKPSEFQNFNGPVDEEKTRKVINLVFKRIKEKNGP
jgi:fatty aldehyde-generating acyl-ACP reductase